MKLRFLVLDGCGHLRKALTTTVRALLAGKLDAAAFWTGDGRHLRLVGVVCDRALVPQNIYLLRMTLTGGRYTAEDDLVLRAFARPECISPAQAVRHHLTGWPRDLLRQFAVVLDVPVAGLDAMIDIGGPVLMSAVTGLSIRQAMMRLDGRS